MKYLLDGEETDRIHFERIDAAHADQWINFFNDPSSFLYWNVEREAPEVECRKWYEKQTHRYTHDLGGMNALIEKSTGNLIGHCGLLAQTVDDVSELEIGYSLLGNYRGKGFAIEAAKKCRDFAFENKFSDSLISIISLANALSAQVAIKNGMQVSKQTIYHGNAVNIFRIKIQDWKGRI